MTDRKIEILKLGDIIPRVSDGKISDKKMITIVFDGGHIFDHHISILKERCKDDYHFMKTSKNIVGGPLGYKINADRRLIGNICKDPIVGNQLEICDGVKKIWHSAVIERIVEENIIITNTSIYAIHDQSEIREKILNQIL